MTDSKENGYLSLQLRIMGNEIIGLRIDVDDFKTKWVLIAVGVSAAGVAALPTIQGFFS